MPDRRSLSDLQISQIGFRITEWMGSESGRMDRVLDLESKIVMDPDLIPNG